MMRATLLTIALLGLGLAACGGATSCGGAGGGGRSPARPGASSAARSGSASSSARLGASDPDGDGDRPLSAGGGATAYDGDDGEVSSYGHAAGAADAQAVTTLVNGYYAAAAAQDGARACSLTYYILAESMPEEYGRPPGPRYLQGAGSCQAVLSIVFKRFHAQLAEPPRVTGVRVNGTLAYALLAWTRLPAGYIEARREGHAWKVDHVLAAQLP